MLLSGAVALATPVFVRRAHTGDVDVVVIGAGAAGISAARELTRRGLAVTVIEADSRIGGRVHTDTEAFGAPFDIGAHWLHNREANPFVDYGLKHGFDMYESPDEGAFHVGDRVATDEEYAAYKKAFRAAMSAMSRAGRKGQDVAASEVVPDLGEWGLTVDLYAGAYEMAADFDSISCVDWYSSEGGTDWYCREGFGTLFAHSARDVPVTLETAASEVRWGGPGVEVVTDNGTIKARAVIVTVSMGVLASGDIKFDPPLPVKKQEAVDALTMGHLMHVALQLNENFFGVGEDGYFGYKITEEMNGAPKGFGALVDAGGHGITYCDLGADFARQMSDEGPGATYDFVVTELKRAFGSKVEDAIENRAPFSTGPRTPMPMGHTPLPNRGAPGRAASCACRKPTACGSRAKR